MLLDSVFSTLSLPREIPEFFSEISDLKKDVEPGVGARHISIFDTDGKHQKIILKFVPLISGSKPLQVSNILEDKFEEQGVLTFEGKIGVVGVKLIRPIQFYAKTNKEISILTSIFIPNDFVLEYEPDISDYLPQLKEELESLCRMILKEDDLNLTNDARLLKQRLGKYILVTTDDKNS